MHNKSFQRTVKKLHFLPPAEFASYPPELRIKTCNLESA